MIDLRRLEVFREAARRGSLSAAARALFTSPSAVSQNLRLLERELGVTLLIREHQGVTLTEAGATLLAHAERLLGDAAQVEADLRAIRRGRSGHLRIASFPTATTSFVASAIRSFESSWSNYDVTVRDGEPYEASAWLRDRAVDLAIVFSLERWPAERPYADPETAAGEIGITELFEDPFGLVMPSSHPLSDCPLLPIGVLHGQRVLAMRPWRDDLMALCASRGVEPRWDERFETADFSVYQALAVQTEAVTALPALARSMLAANMRWVPMLPNFTRRVCIAQPAEEQGSAPVMAIARALKAAAREINEPIVHLIDGLTPRRNPASDSPPAPGRQTLPAPDAENVWLAQAAERLGASG